MDFILAVVLVVFLAFTGVMAFLELLVKTFTTDEERHEMGVVLD